MLVVVHVASAQEAARAVQHAPMEEAAVAAASQQEAVEPSEAATVPQMVEAEPPRAEQALAAACAEDILEIAVPTVVLQELWPIQ